MIRRSRRTLCRLTSRRSDSWSQVSGIAERSQVSARQHWRADSASVAALNAERAISQYNSTPLLHAPGSERTEFMERTHANMLVMGQLETTTAFANLEAILEVKGIDAFAWGPNDLAQSMGLPGQPQHPDVLTAQRQVADKIHAAGGKLNSDLMVAINLPELIVKGAQQFLTDNL